MRERISLELKEAQKAKDKVRVSTLRLVQAAINDRDIANRGCGKDRICDDDVLTILAKMIKQREESAKAYEEGGRIELAEQERAEIAIIREFMPAQLSAAEIETACRKAIDEVSAEGLRDMGKCMAALKEKYPGQMDFAQVSGIVKTMLR